MGPKTIEFENAFRAYIDSQFAISVNSATAALHLALNAVGVGIGDEVIIPTNTFISTAEAVLYSGAKPILCDIEEKNHNINVEAFQSNHEGEIVDMIQKSNDLYQGLIINPGALSHYSISIRDAISSISIPVVEVHLSNVFTREKFRNHSVISDVCSKMVVGFGSSGYKIAVGYFIN